MDNKELYLYGMGAKFKTIAGWLIIMIFSFISLAADSFIMWVIGVGLGIFLIYKGKSQRFDYKRQSGMIIHKGD